VQNIVLTKPDTNVLIYGYENRLKITGVKWEGIQFISSRSKVTQIIDGYSLSIDKADFDTISIIYDDEVVYEKIFHVNKCSQSTYLVSGSLDTIMTKEKLLKNPELGFVAPHCLMKTNKMMIRSYDIKITRGQDILLNENAKIKFYSKNVELVISQLVSGDKVTFYNVVITNGDICPRKFPKRVITIH
jgi:hypothetical protein